MNEMVTGTSASTDPTETAEVSVSTADRSKRVATLDK